MLSLVVLLSLVVANGLQGDFSEKNTKNGAYLNGGNVRTAAMYRILSVPWPSPNTLPCVYSLASGVYSRYPPSFPHLHHSPSTTHQGPTLGEELVNGEKIPADQKWWHHPQSVGKGVAVIDNTQGVAGTNELAPAPERPVQAYGGYGGAPFSQRAYGYAPVSPVVVPTTSYNQQAGSQLGLNGRSGTSTLFMELGDQAQLRAHEGIGQYQYQQHQAATVAHAQHLQRMWQWQQQQQHAALQQQQHQQWQEQQRRLVQQQFTPSHIAHTAPSAYYGRPRRSY